MPTRKLTPLEAQRAAQNRHGYGTILLARDGDWATVRVRVGDLYVPVIQELHEDQFYHFVEPLGIEDEIAIFFSRRKPLFEFTSMVNWVRTATGRFQESGHTSADSICIDAKGRIINGGGGFEQADRDGSYPVKVYSTKAAESEHQGRKGSRERNRRVAFPAGPRSKKQKRNVR